MIKLYSPHEGEIDTLGPAVEEGTMEGECETEGR